MIKYKTKISKFIQDESNRRKGIKVGAQETHINTEAYAFTHTEIQ